MQTNKIFKLILIPMILSSSWCWGNGTDNTKKKSNNISRTKSSRYTENDNLLENHSEKQVNSMGNETKINLDTIITNQNKNNIIEKLKKIKTNKPDGVPSEKQVEKVLKSECPELDLKHIHIHIRIHREPGNNNATINVDIISTRLGDYTGCVKLDYTVQGPGKETEKDLNERKNQTQKDLNEIIQDKEGWTFMTKKQGDTPSEDQVKKALKAKYSELEPSDIHVIIFSLDHKKIQVSPENYGLYSGIVELKYTTQQKPLKDIINNNNNNNLGRIKLNMKNPISLKIEVANRLQTVCDKSKFHMIDFDIIKGDKKKAGFYRSKVNIVPKPEYVNYFQLNDCETVDFELERFNNLNDIIRDKNDIIRDKDDLGEIKPSDEYALVSKEEVKCKLKEKYPFLNPKIIRIAINNAEPEVEIHINNEYYDYFIDFNTYLNLKFNINYRETSKQKYFITEYNNNKEDKNCSECSKSLKGEKSGVLPCGDYLHNTCIKTCIKTIYDEATHTSLVCPKCKKHMSPIRMLPLINS